MPWCALLQASMAMLRELDAESRYERMVGAPSDLV